MGRDTSDSYGSSGRTGGQDDSFGSSGRTGGLGDDSYRSSGGNGDSDSYGVRPASSP